MGEVAKHEPGADRTAGVSGEIEGEFASSEWRTEFASSSQSTPAVQIGVPSAHEPAYTRDQIWQICNQLIRDHRLPGASFQIDSDSEGRQIVTFQYTAALFSARQERDLNKWTFYGRDGDVFGRLEDILPEIEAEVAFIAGWGSRR